jgi:hypothetical protein
VKFKSLHEKAKLLDDLIDEYRKTKRTSVIPTDRLSGFVLSIFPDGTLLSYGVHKLAFRLKHKSHVLVLKVGRPQTIEHDHKAFKQLPHDLRNVYFAKVFWHTKYALLQEFGVEADVSQQELGQIRYVAGKYGLLDITCDNIRTVDGNHKIVDATVAPPGLFKIWRIGDSIIMRLPSPVKRALRKSLLLATAKRR